MKDEIEGIQPAAGNVITYGGAKVDPFAKPGPCRAIKDRIEGRRSDRVGGLKLEKARPEG